jgi:hypothetical protein
MPRILAIALLFAVAADLGAQPNMPELPFPQVEQFSVKDGALRGWAVTQGASNPGPEGISLGGKDATKVELTTPLGEQWRLEVEYKIASVGGSPMLQWDAGRSWQLPQAGDRWVQLTITCNSRGGWSRSYWLNYSHQSDGSSGSGGLAGGSGQVRSLAINVPAGSTMVIRRLALQTSPPVVKDTSGLYIGIGVLVGCIFAVMAFGWFLNRRRRPAPAAHRPE